MEHIDLNKLFDKESTIQTNCFDKDLDGSSSTLRRDLYTDNLAVRIYTRLGVSSGLSVNWPADYEIAHAVLKNPAGEIVEKKSIMLSQLRVAETDAWGDHIHSVILGPIEIKEMGAYQLYFEGRSLLDGINGKFITISTSIVVASRNNSTDKFSDVHTIVICPSASHRNGRGGAGYPVWKPNL